MLRDIRGPAGLAAVLETPFVFRIFSDAARGRDRMEESVGHGAHDSIRAAIRAIECQRPFEWCEDEGGRWRCADRSEPSR